MRLSASQLAVCIVMSLLYKPCTRHGKKLHSCSFELTFSSIANCRPQFLHLQVRITINEKMKVTVDVDDLLEELSIAAIPSELHAEDYAEDTTKTKLSVNKNEVFQQSL